MVDESKKQDRAQVGWPCGKTTRPSDELPQILIDAGQHHARRAVRLYQSDDNLDLLDAAISTGAAVEMMAKACIATMEPALLAGKSNGLSVQNAVLYLRGHHTWALGGVKELIGFNTIDAKTAVKAARRFDRHQQIPKTCNPDIAIDVRDAAIHMALVECQILREAVREMVQFVNGARERLDLDYQTFWHKRESEFEVEVQASIVSTFFTQVKQKIDRAAAVYEAAFGSLEPHNLAAIKQVSTNSFTAPDDMDLYPARCPACNSEGFLFLHQDVDMEPDGDDYTASPFWIVVKFECPHCRLELDHDELPFADLPDDGDEVIASYGHPSDEGFHMERARGL